VKSYGTAWVDPDQCAQWWGTRITLTTHAKDFKVGGTWKYTMHGPDGTNFGKYHEVSGIESITMVYDHGGNDVNPPIVPRHENSPRARAKPKWK